MNLAQLLAAIAAGEPVNMTAANRSLLEAHFEARREAAGDSPTGEDAELLDQILNAIEAIDVALAAAPEGSEEVDTSEREGEDEDEGDPEALEGGQGEAGDPPEGDSTEGTDGEQEAPGGSEDAPPEGDPVDLADIDDRHRELVVASGARRTRRRPGRGADLEQVRSNAGAPPVNTDRPGPRFVAMGNTSTAPVGTVLDDSMIGEAMTEAARAAQHQPRGTVTRVMSVDLADTLAVKVNSQTSAEQYTSAVQASVAAARKEFYERATVQASGGMCAPPEIDYTRTLTGGSEAGSFANSHPGVQTRRPHSFYAPEVIDVSAATPAGVGVVTDAQDAAGYGDPDADPSTVPAGGAPFKSPVVVDCPDEMVTCRMSAVYQAVQSGRFMDIAFPEQVALVRNKTAVYGGLARDRVFSDVYVSSGRRLLGDAATFGVSRDTLSSIRRLVAAARSIRGDRTLPFNVWAPAWFGSPVATDLAKSFTGTQDLGPNIGRALGSLAQDEGIGLGNYSHNIGATTDGSPSVLPNPRLLANGAAVPAWPTQARLLIAPIGSVIRNTAGTISFGVESTGMATNDSLTFSEIFESPCVVDSSAMFVLDVSVAELGGTGAMVDAS